MQRHRLLGLALAALPLLAAVPARAAGLYFADRGVRPAARGGAFIAGGDDLGAIAYNIAGIYDAGGQILVDASWLNFSSDYTRKSLLRQVDPNTGETVSTSVQTFTPVSGEAPFLPIPTLAVSFKLNPQWVLAVGAWAPYAAIASYPEEVKGKAAPQRYSLFTLDGSALTFIGVGAAYAPIKQLRIGLALGVLAGTFRTKAAFSGCAPERFLCGPEDPDWDILSELSVGPIIAPSGELGAVYIPHPDWRVGVSFQAPVYVRAPATIKTRLPASPVFERASQAGEDADVAFDLPWNIRLGVESRMVPDLRLELGFGYERWSMHDNIYIDPDGMALKNVAAFPETYYVPEIVFPRNFQDTISVRLGGEYSFKLAGLTWDARAGASFETSAVPAEYLSVLTIDSPKITTALGAGLHLDPWRFDVVYAHIFAHDVEVAPGDARVTQVTPLAANPPRNPDYINGGDYSARGDVIGLGVVYTFDPAIEAETPPATPAAPAKP